MKRPLIVTGALLLLVGLTSADGDGPDAPYETRRAEFARDAEMIEAFVEEGLLLAQQEDPLQRARTCNALAKRLAQEIQDATDKKATARVVALGDLLQAVLIRGVADNLEQAKKEAPKEALRGKEIAKVADQSSDVTAPLEKTLKKTLETLDAAAEKDAMAPALEGLTRAREEVESASTGKGRGKDKGKGKGKKKW